MYTRRLLVSVVCVLLASLADLHAREEKLALDKLPAAVLKTIKTTYPTAELVEAEQEIEDGETEYAVTLKVSGREIEMKFDSRGRLKEEKRSEEDDDEFTSDFSTEKPDLVSTGTNPFFVLEPGYQLVLEHGGEQLTITVLNETKVVDGVETRIVEERETKNGQLVEVSRNFYAISKRTNSVYYFGEEVDDYKDGKIIGHEGSWLSGVNNARFGLMMPGFPLLEAKFQQEFAPAIAMDRAEIVIVDVSISVPAGQFKKCLVIEETTPLEPRKLELKKYAPHVGLIIDGDLKLVRYGKK